jgi:hypothetical protein
MANIKISQLTPKGANLASTDLLEISESAGGGTYVTKSITGAEIIAAASGGSANPSVVAASYADGTAVTGTTTNTISQSLLIPANTFTNGMLECFLRMNKTGTAGTTSVRMYSNTSNSLTGAALIASFGSLGTTSVFLQGERKFRINTNLLTGFTTTLATPSDITTGTGVQLSTAFNTSVSNYIIFAIQLNTTTDSANITMARLIKSS